MIIVTGANGRLGRGVVEQLIGRLPVEQIGISVRDPQKATALAERGVRVRRGDFADPSSLVHSFEDASQVLIVSPDTLGEVTVRLNRTAIDAAAAAGVDRILYTSQMAANPASLFAPMPDHAATEAALAASGVPFTSLRNGFYASSAVMLLGAALDSGELAVPEDGPVAWTSHDDLAEAAAIALTSNRLDGLTPALTASAVIDMAGVAAIASELTGRPIRRVVVSDEEYRASLIGHGVPESAADLLVGLFAASRQGEFAPADPTLGRLLGRSPETVRDVLTSTVTAVVTTRS